MTTGLRERRKRDPPYEQCTRQALPDPVIRFPVYYRRHAPPLDCLKFSALSVCLQHFASLALYVFQVNLMTVAQYS